MAGVVGVLAVQWLMCSYLLLCQWQIKDCDCERNTPSWQLTLWQFIQYRWMRLIHLDVHSPCYYFSSWYLFTLYILWDLSFKYFQSLDIRVGLVYSDFWTEDKISVSSSPRETLQRFLTFTESQLQHVNYDLIHLIRYAGVGCHCCWTLMSLLLNLLISDMTTGHFYT